MRWIKDNKQLERSPRFTEDRYNSLSLLLWSSSCSSSSKLLYYSRPPQYCRSGLAKTVVKGVLHSQEKHIRDLKINGSIGGEAFNGGEAFWGTTVLQRCLEQPVSDYFWKPDFCENNLLLVFSTTYLILIQEYTEDTVTKEEWWGSVPVSLQVHQQSSLLYIYRLSPWCPRYALSQTSFKNPLF